MNKWRKLNVIGPDCEINRKGQVRRKIITLGGRVFKDFIRKATIDVHGYEYMGFRENGFQKNHTIHRLVAITFIPNPKNKPMVNHKDGNKRNNNVENLEWVTAMENSKHAIAMGLMKHPIGEANKRSLLTNKDVKNIKKRLTKGDKQCDIAKDYNVHYSLISHIKAGRKWNNSK